MPSDTLAALDQIPAAQISAAICRLSARLLVPVEPATLAAPDELLTPDQVAARLQVSKKFVYNHARELGGTKLSRRQLRFSAKRVQRYVEQQR